jgi:hypothetical protein
MQNWVGVDSIPLRNHNWLVHVATRTRTQWPESRVEWEWVGSGLTKDSIRSEIELVENCIRFGNCWVLSVCQTCKIVLKIIGSGLDRLAGWKIAPHPHLLSAKSELDPNLWVLRERKMASNQNSLGIKPEHADLIVIGLISDAWRLTRECNLKPAPENIRVRFEQIHGWKITPTPALIGCKTCRTQIRRCDYHPTAEWQVQHLFREPIF